MSFTHGAPIHESLTAGSSTDSATSAGLGAGGAAAAATAATPCTPRLEAAKQYVADFAALPSQVFVVLF